MRKTRQISDPRIPRDRSEERHAKGIVKMTDRKGRITLGPKFANAAFTIRAGSDASELILTQSRIIPEREAWLYSNSTALALVRAGLDEALQGKSTPAPELEADAALAKQLEDAAGD